MLLTNLAFECPRCIFTCNESEQLVPIHFHCMEKCSLDNLLENFSFCVLCKKKKSHVVWNNMKLSA